MRPSVAASKREPWHWRMRELVGAYLPLLLMALLALATWWLVRNTPVPEGPRPPQPVVHEPDYTMQHFLLRRFGADGRLRVQIEGDLLHHYPDTDTLEIDAVRIRALAPDGSLTLAHARQAQARGDGSEVQLRGGAEVTRTPADGGVPIEFRGEFLHAFVDAERLVSDLPVTLVQGGSRIVAAGIDYDHRTRVARLAGPVRATLETARTRR